MNSVCRTCLNIIKDESVYNHLNHFDTNNDVNYREKLEACVPELTLDIVLEPLICTTCKEKISIAFSFKTQCLETEKTLFNYIQKRQHDENCTDLLNNYDLLVITKNDVILEHNYSIYKKQEFNFVENDVELFKSTLRAIVRSKEEHISNSEIVDSSEPIVKRGKDNYKKLPAKRSSQRVKYKPQILRSKARSVFGNSKRCLTRRCSISPVEEDKENVNSKPKFGFQCTKCNKRFRYEVHLNTHMNSHIIKKLHTCPVCEKSFSHEKHMKAHHLTHSFQCTLCDKRMGSRTSLIRHLKMHSGELRAHPQKIPLSVPDGAAKSFSCDVCKSTFLHKSRLVKHVRTHMRKKSFECSRCQKQFSKNYRLRIHQQMHENNRYQCIGCKRFFKDLSIYRSHVSRFLPQCVAGRQSNKAEGVKMKTKSKMLEDIDNDIDEINRDIAVKRRRLKRLKYICKICSKRFTTNYSRNRHIKYQHDT